AGRMERHPNGRPGFIHFLHFEPVHLPEPTTDNPPSPIFLLDSDRQWLNRISSELPKLGLIPREVSGLNDLSHEIELHSAGCVVTELRMPSSSVFDLLDLLKERDSCLEVMVVTSFASVSTTTQAMRRGVFGVFEKSAELTMMGFEIQAAVRSSQEKRARLDRMRQAERIFEALSDEEHAVMRLAIEGCPNREISNELAISPRTVDRRRQSALRKMNAESVARYATLKTRIEEMSLLFPSRLAPRNQHHSPSPLPNASTSN
ncbi:MAG: LuxR C-terminal-related transcriptional regulator, partial [Planctomycetota bacterium]